MLQKFPMLQKNAKVYNLKEEDLKTTYNKIPKNGFGSIIIPATSKSHMSFAVNAPEYENFAISPLIGWISGVHLNELGTKSPKVFNGQTMTSSSTDAVLVTFELDNSYYCDIGIVNIFEQGTQDSIEFIESGFSVKDALINGQKKNFSDYLIEKKVDVRFPLVANYAGAMINVSFQANDEKNKIVNLYAPVFKGTTYKLAAPATNYVEQFSIRLPQNSNNIAFSCNCILNFLYSELEGKKTGQIVGPITFGEIAYQLLNQTMAYLTIEKH